MSTGASGCGKGYEGRRSIHGESGHVCGWLPADSDSSSASFSVTQATNLFVKIEVESSVETDPSEDLEAPVEVQVKQDDQSVEVNQRASSEIEIMLDDQGRIVAVPMEGYDQYDAEAADQIQHILLEFMDLPAMDINPEAASLWAELMGESAGTSNEVLMGMFQVPNLEGNDRVAAQDVDPIEEEAIPEMLNDQVASGSSGGSSGGRSSEEKEETSESFESLTPEEEEEAKGILEVVATSSSDPTLMTIEVRARPSDQSEPVAAETQVALPDLNVNAPEQQEEEPISRFDPMMLEAELSNEASLYRLRRVGEDQPRDRLMELVDQMVAEGDLVETRVRLEGEPIRKRRD
ncbi:uncharacterized protein LOC17880894 [Capsella rubella]|uniref:uncharacterized protein LOC17880894 n=1 Tax=Capsella rubella TaxID=81985 RepID=UPI000CD4F099|nr:uncharacterized protein LOC17880894 [Capsella rubella]